MTDTTTKRRRIWPWLVALAVVVALGVAAYFAVSTLGEVYREAPVKAVEQLEQSLADLDCSTFQTLTSTEVQAAYFSTEGEFSCAEWQTIAADFTADGKYRYGVTVESVEVNGTQAIVKRTETDAADDTAFDVTYGLTLSDGSWIITDYLVVAAGEEGAEE